MKNKVFEEKIHGEIIVDCNDEYDQNMSWFYYAQDELEFPFIAYLRVKKVNGGEVLRKVNVIQLCTNDSNFEKNFDLIVEVEFGEYFIEIPLSKLEDIKAPKSITEIIEIWKYWRKKN